ncbi:MAG: hypothetical protein ABIY55_07175 [Kofleriaceae bacterium]
MTVPSDAGGPSTPSDPLESLEPIARIEAALSRLGQEHEPPLGWEARVLAATAPPRRRAWWWFAAPAMLAAAAAVVFVIIPPAKPSALQLAMVVEKGSAVVRMSGPEPQLGDTVHATATGGGGHRGVWVYHNETELVLQCPGPVHCRRSDDTVTADIALGSIGTYQIVALSSSAALPLPTGKFDEDVAAAVRANVTVSRQELTIR